MSFLKNRTVVGVICILLSLLICFGLTPLFNQSVSQKAEIVRVVQPIRAGDEITESMVQIVEVGGYNLPEDVLRQKESAVGKYATADLAVGDYIIPSKLSDAPAAENAYLYSLDGSQQAISVSIKSFAEGLSGKLQSGDIVSVIARTTSSRARPLSPLSCSMWRLSVLPPPPAMTPTPVSLWTRRMTRNCPILSPCWCPRAGQSVGRAGGRGDHPSGAGLPGRPGECRQVPDLSRRDHSGIVSPGAGPRGETTGESRRVRTRR